jgi:translation initiation factor 2 alpha subunit (eIF-2alpha)
MTDEFEEGQLVLCTVERIMGTTVFVRIGSNGEGTITTSEIAPGRIRNLRDYVVPNKKIVCKILSIRDSKIQLSLRRVKPAEKKELLEKIAKETSYKAILETVLGEKFAETIEKITQEFSITEFFEKSKQNPAVLQDFIDKENAEKIIKILESKKEKQKEIKQIFKLSNKSSKGIVAVKNLLLDSCKDSKCRITYLAAGKYLLTIKGENFKFMKSEINKILENLENQAKKQNCEFLIEKN